MGFGRGEAGGEDGAAEEAGAEGVAGHGVLLGLDGEAQGSGALGGAGCKTVKKPRDSEGEKVGGCVWAVGGGSVGLGAGRC
ncbi:MAG: hypothetical protein DHS20C14_05170 [Phycisphaeraceae bacterium]|nr:MAG: hypothetical protein DHS20C14_05170 [Phycisphaeraceae bacterium]